MDRTSYLRSSVRSRGSSRYSSNSDVDTKTKIKDCCRKTVAFMCSQIGVIGLIVGYTLTGAISFMKIELKGVDNNYYKAQELRKEYSKKLWLVARIFNVFNETVFVTASNKVLQDYQSKLVILVKEHNYDGRSVKSMWTFPAALMFSLSVITMIGYGDIVPRTIWGKICTVVYAVFGIPLYVLYFLNVGKGLAGLFKWIYVWFVKCSSPPGETRQKRIIVPSTACLWVISGYILFGTVMFAQWERWSFLDSSYFCITSLCKLGFGDLVPGNISTKSGSQMRLVMNYFYMFFGQGLVAMCYHLMSEEVRVKVNEMSEDFHMCLRDTQTRMNSCFRRRQNVEMMYYK